MRTIKVEDIDENADWIKWRTDDVKVSEEAKKLLFEEKELDLDPYYQEEEGNEVVSDQ